MRSTHCLKCVWAKDLYLPLVNLLDSTCVFNLHANNGSLCMSDCPLTSDHRISLCTDIVTSSPKTQDHKACTLCHLTELVVFTH